MKLFLYCTLIILLLVPFIFISCDSNNPEDFDNKFSFIQPNYSIYLNTLPSTVLLDLNKSVFIENGNSTFKFAAVLENNLNNSSVLLEVQYNSGVIKLVELNTNKDPIDYYLENEYCYVVNLKELNITENTY